MRTKLSLYAAHKKRWAGGCGSPICARAANVVLARGTIPCDVLFVGESPGDSEDALGKPFCGPAGRLLDFIVEQAVSRASGGPYRVAFTNLTGCIPRDEGGLKGGQPDDECVESCKPRLEEFITIAKPKVIVCVGAQPKGWFERGFKHSVKYPKDITVVNITHPSAILRMNVAHQSLAITRNAVLIENALDAIGEAK